MRKIVKATVLAGLAGAMVTALASPALADPSVTPKATDVVGVGSDTTQNVLNQLSTDYNAQSPAPSRHLYSWDAVGTPDPVSLKAGCTAVTRPNGSSAGITALKSNQRPTGDKSHYCVDFARSSRGPQAGDTSAIAFVQFAQDAVTWSADSQPNKASHAPASLSILQLQAIYSCDASLLGTGASGPVHWNQVGGTSTNAVVPVIPQSQSGTRKFFLTAIGVSTLGSCVKGQDNSVEENEGTNAIFSSSQSRDIVFPYSVAVYLAQSQYGHDAGAQGSQKLRSATTADGSTVIAPLVGTTGAKKINPALAAVGLTRYVYNVVRNNGTAQHVPTYLQGIFGANSDTGWLCSSAAAKADIRSYGFNTIGSACGAVSISAS